MGKAYHLKCGLCGWNEVFYLGLGKNDNEEQANKALYSLLESSSGKKWLDFINAQLHATLSIERNMYLCKYCGRLQVRLQAHLKGDETLICPAYYCDSCGKMLKKLRPNMIKNQLCPCCRNQVMIERVTEWDVAPNAETAVKP